MAKEIKAIQCPKCGSTQKTEIRTDFYRCESCQTEYFLDNDDINVNIRQSNNTVPQVVTDYGKIRKIFLIGVSILFGLGVISRLITALFIDTSSPSTTYTVGEADRSGTVEEEEEKASWGSDEMTCFGTDNNPVVARIGKKTWGGSFSKDTRNGIYVTFYDAVKKEEIKSEKLINDDGTSSSPNIDIRKFSNNRIYFTVNKNKIFQIDAVSLTVKDVSVDLFKSQPALSSGVATMEFAYENYGDGLSIMTNDGKNYYYYPVVNKLYTKEQLDKVRGGYNTVLPGAKERYTYLFTSGSDDFPNEKIQLLKVLYKDNMGGPMDQISHVEWTKDYGHYGIIYDNEPYTKVLITDYWKEESRIKSFSDLTPGRLYFGGSVPYYDDNGELIIKFLPDANPATTPIIQSLNSGTGAIKWTYPLGKSISIDEVCSYKDGYMFLMGQKILLLDKSGKESSTYELED